MLMVVYMITSLLLSSQQRYMIGEAESEWLTQVQSETFMEEQDLNLDPTQSIFYWECIKNVLSHCKAPPEVWG